MIVNQKEHRVPQIELKYTSDIEFDVTGMLETAIKTIKSADDSVGNCRGRAYPLKDYVSSHIRLEIEMLDKPHRDDIFMQKLSESVSRAVRTHVSTACAISVICRFDPPQWATTITVE